MSIRYNALPITSTKKKMKMKTKIFQNYKNNLYFYFLNS